MSLQLHLAAVKSLLDQCRFGSDRAANVLRCESDATAWSVLLSAQLQKEILTQLRNEETDHFQHTTQKAKNHDPN